MIELRAKGIEPLRITGISKKNDERMLSQPPHFGRVGQHQVERTTDPKILAAQKAIHAIRDSQFDRPRMGRSNGARPGLI